MCIYSIGMLISVYLYMCIMSNKRFGTGNSISQKAKREQNCLLGICILCGDCTDMLQIPRLFGGVVAIRLDNLLFFSSIR